MRNITLFFGSKKHSFKLPSALLFMLENLKGLVILLFIAALLLLSSVLATSMLLEYKSVRQAYLKSVMRDYAVKSDNINKHIEFTLKESGVFYHIAGISYTPKSMRDFGVGGGAISDNQSIYDRLSIEHNVNKNILDNVVFNKKNILNKIREINYELSIMPCIVPTEGYISSNFGYRVHPILNSIEFHKGIDISARTGTPIVTAASGVVVRSQYSGAYGNVVEIEHGDGRYKTLYAHMHRRKVSVGDVVKKGETIGTVGATGRVTGAHLHYEVIQEGKLVNPRNFFFPDHVIVD